MMVKTIKLMADYQCWPLWWTDNDAPGNIDPSTLPLTPVTVARLNQWAAQFDKRLNWNEPNATPPLTSDEVDAFEREGVSLWLKLRDELHPDYSVTYYSAKHQKLFKHPDELE
jgi:hypothetical protein